MVFDYDKEADVLYVVFEQTSGPCQYVETKNELILRIETKSDRVVGMTIPSFSKRREFPIPGVDAIVTRTRQPSRAKAKRAHGAS